MLGFGASMAARGRFLGFGGGGRAVLLLVNPPLAPPRRGTRHVDGWWGGYGMQEWCRKIYFLLDACVVVGK